MRWKNPWSFPILLISISQIFCQGIDFCIPDEMFKITEFTTHNNQPGFNITLQDRLIFQHPDNLFVGNEDVQYTFLHGKFLKKSKLIDKVPVLDYQLTTGSDISEFDFTIQYFYQDINVLSMNFVCEQNVGSIAHIDIVPNPEMKPGSPLPTYTINRYWLKLHSEASEKLFGGGENFEHVNLKGSRFSVIVEDRTADNLDIVNFLDDYWEDQSSYWVTPLVVSNRLNYFYLDSTAVSIFDFRDDNFIDIEMHIDLDRYELEATRLSMSTTFNDYTTLYDKLTTRLGRVNRLPDFALGSSILGVQGGSDKVNQIYQQGLENGANIKAIWIQDWSGKVVNENTGWERLYWNWEWNQEYYPTLKEDIQAYAQNQTYFLVYVNPHLVKGSNLYNQALEQNVLIKQRKTDAQGNYLPHLDNFGAPNSEDFVCGTLDLTTSKGREFLRLNILNPIFVLGIKGFMADFSEYLPLDNQEIILDCELENNDENRCRASNVHNEFPALFAETIYDSVLQYDGLSVEELFIFHRSGSLRTPPPFWVDYDHVGKMPRARLRGGQIFF